MFGNIAITKLLPQELGFFAFLCEGRFLDLLEYSQDWLFLQPICSLDQMFSFWKALHHLLSQSQELELQIIIVEMPTYYLFARIEADDCVHLQTLTP